MSPLFSLLSLQEDEEWKDFEQKEVDYTGLRLQAMQMRCEAQTSNTFDATGDFIVGNWTWSRIVRFFEAHFEVVVKATDMLVQTAAYFI